MSDNEQFLISAQFVDKINKYYIIREEFLCFVPVEDVTRKRLTSTLLIKIKDIGINLDNMRGQDIY